MLDQPQISRFAVTVEAPRLGTAGSRAFVELEPALVRLRAGAVDLDVSARSAAAVERLDSETFRLTLGATWIVRPLNVVDFLFEAAPLFARAAPAARRRRLPPLPLHLALTLSVLVVGLALGRAQFDGSETITWLVAGLMLVVGLLWSRLWNLDGPGAPDEPALPISVIPPATVEVRRTVSGSVELIREILGDRLGEPESRPPHEWLPAITIETGRRTSIHLLPHPGTAAVPGPSQSSGPLGNLSPT